ncbi:MAG: hypothetical protein ACXWQ5_18495 [Ktedonobacterales bacterium]
MRRRILTLIEATGLLAPVALPAVASADLLPTDNGGQTTVSAPAIPRPGGSGNWRAGSVQAINTGHI